MTDSQTDSWEFLMMRWELQQALIIERMERMEKKIEMLYEKKYGIPYPQHSQTMSTSFPQSILMALF